MLPKWAQQQWEDKKAGWKQTIPILKSDTLLQISFITSWKVILKYTSRTLKNVYSYLKSWLLFKDSLDPLQ